MTECYSTFTELFLPEKKEKFSSESNKRKSERGSERTFFAVFWRESSTRQTCSCRTLWCRFAEPLIKMLHNLTQAPGMMPNWQIDVPSESIFQFSAHLARWEMRNYHVAAGKLMKKRLSSDFWRYSMCVAGWRSRRRHKSHPPTMKKSIKSSEEGAEHSVKRSQRSQGNGNICQPLRVIVASIVQKHLESISGRRYNG